MKLGIDFGTTRTVVAAVDDGRHPIASFDEGGEHRAYIPGVAALRGRDLLLGWEATRALNNGAYDHAIRSIKREIQIRMPDDEVLPGITALELVTRFLEDVRLAILERSTLDPALPLEVMVSAPANAASRQRWLTLEAFRAAGFQPIGLLNEPTAAAVELAHHHLRELGKKSPKRYVVVYDLGGGTFDTSAVSLEGRHFELIAAEGIARLGGDDFDELVLAAACDALGIPHLHDAASLERAREAKETLRATSKKLLVDLGPHGTATIDAGLLYARCEPLIERTIAQTDLLFDRLRSRGIDPDDPRELGGIYLVGGAAAFPAVTKRLRARFGKKLQLAPQPFAATAVGLAIAADPDAHVMIREAVTRHFGVWREAEGGADKVFDSLIDKDAPAPTTIERRYHPTHAVGHLRFYECGAVDEGGQPVQDLVPWTDIYFPYDPQLADRGELAQVAADRRPDLMDLEIAETYTYAPDGTIKVRIENVSRGYGRTYELGALR
jgi:molecular chaperone DnaK (HSP70)